MVGENESIDIPVASPVGVLLLHGLFGTPNELLVLGGQIARAGYRVRIPLLPGRGASLDALDRLSWREVRDAALAEYEELAREHERVVVGGLSAGGTLALDLALLRPPTGLLLYAPALSIRYRAINLAPYVWRVLRRWPMPGDGRRVPVRAIGELVGAMRRVRAGLGRIHVPALVIHSVDDPLTPASSGIRVSRELGGPVRLVLREGATHAVTAGAERDEIGALTLAWLRELVPLCRKATPNDA